MIPLIGKVVGKKPLRRTEDQLRQKLEEIEQQLREHRERLRQQAEVWELRRQLRDAERELREHGLLKSLGYLLHPGLFLFWLVLATSVAALVLYVHGDI